MKRIVKASFVSWTGAILLAASPRVVQAQAGCLISQPPNTIQMPQNTVSEQRFHMANSSAGNNTPAFYVTTSGGVARVDLSTPGSPTAQIQQLANRQPFHGPVPVTPTGDIWTWLSNANGYEDGGTGRVVTDWPNPYGSVLGQAQAVNVTASLLAFGQQLNPSGAGTDLGPGPAIQVLKVSSNYYAYTADGPGNIYVTDVTSLSGSAASPAILGQPTGLVWQHLTDLEGGTQTANPYLFGATFAVDGTGHLTGTLHIAKVFPGGSVSEVSLGSVATYPGAGSIGVSFQNNKYWVFAIQKGGASPAPTGIRVFQFDPASATLTTNTSWFITAPSGRAYSDIRVRGDVVPIVFAFNTTLSGGSPSGYDVIGTQYLVSGGSPTVSGTIPYTVPMSAAWEVYVKTTAGQTMAYLYVPLSANGGNGEPRIQTTPVDVSCAAVNCNQPPLASLTITNTSAHFPADPINYVGDSFHVEDTSASCDPPSLVQWDLNYNGTSFTGDANPGLPNAPPWQFTTVLPCDPDRLGVDIVQGANCYDPTTLPASPFNWRVANEATNSHGTSQTPGQQMVALAKPLTQVKNFANGVVQILSGNPIDASISQGSPGSYSWSAPSGCVNVTTATCTVFNDGDAFQVSASYRGGYTADPVSGTVHLTALIADFTYPATVLFSTQFVVTNACTISPSASVTGMSYYIDMNPSGGGNYQGLPTSFWIPGHTTTIMAPAVAGSYYIHFRVDYTGTPAGPVFFDGPLSVTDVQYQPLISVSPASPDPQHLGGYFVDKGADLSFKDQPDFTKPPLPLSWDFGDGSAIVTSSTNQVVHHTYTVTGQKTVTLTLSGIPPVTSLLTISNPSGGCPPNCPPPPGCTVGVSGPTSLQPGVAGLWTATTSGCSGGVTWGASDSSTGSGPTFNHAFANPGSAFVRATSGTTSRTYAVSIGSSGGGGSLTVSISGVQSIPVGQSGTWTAVIGGASGTPSVSWLVSDNPINHFSGGTLTHTFGAAGSYTISCAVSDTAGHTAAAQLSVTAAGTPPPSGQFNMSGATLAFNSLNNTYSASLGDPLTFTATETDQTVTFAWTFSDGGTATGNPAVHTFLTPGTKQVNLTATRPGAPSGNGSRNVTITGQAFAGLVVPGAGYLQINDNAGNPIGAYATELSLVNNSTSALTVDFDFEPTTAGSINPSQITFNSAFRQVLAPHEGWYSADVTGSYLGGTGIGTLFLKYSGSLQAPSAVTRIYFSGGAGTPTYGTYLPAYPVNSSGQSLSAVSTTTQYLVGLQFNGFSPGLTLVASSPAGGNFNVDLFRDDGTPLSATMPVTLAGYAQAKIPISTNCGTLPQCFSISSADAASHTFYAEVTPQNTAAATPVIALASVVDDQTKDSMIISDDTPRLAAPPPGSNSTLFVPGVGKITANGANWGTDLYLLNPSQQAVSIIFTYFYSADGGPEQQAVAVQTIASGEQVALRDVVASVFPSVAGSGATILGQLRLDFQPGADGAPLIVEGRIANDQPGGSYGMQLPSYATTDGVLPSSGQITLAGLRNDDGTRTNFGFTAMSSGSDPVTVHAVAYSDADGSQLWSGDYTLNANGFGHFLLQPSKGVPGFDALQNAAFSLVVTVTSGTGATPVAAFATVIDELSSDPIFVPGKRPAQ